MIRQVCVTVTVLLGGLGADLQAGSVPVVELQRGVNTIPITLVNQSWRDLPGVSVTVEGGALPSWVRLLPNTRAVDMPAGHSGQRQMVLRIEVTDPPADGATLELPLVVRATRGDEWRVAVQARVAQALPETYILSQNHPNPFNPTTTIPYAIPGRKQGAGSATLTPAPVSLAIYNLAGQRVVTLVDAPQAPGTYTAQWDGRDRDGHPVASGTYVYRLVAGEFVAMKKMTMLQ